MEGDDLLLSVSRFESEFNSSTTQLKPEYDFDGNTVKADLPLIATLQTHEFDASQVQREDIDGVKGAFVLRNVLSVAECEALETGCFGEGEEAAAKAAHAHPVLWRPAEHTKERQKLGIRAIRSSDEIAAQLWDRVKKYFPDTYSFQGRDWKIADPVALHSRHRFVAYDHGQRFPPHMDAPRVIGSHTRSFFTILFYLGNCGSLLNRKDFRGGELRFLQGDAVTKQTRLVQTLTPEAGMVVVFPHATLHEGATLKSGRKCVIRNDVLYTIDEDELTKQPALAEDPMTAGFQIEEGQH